MKLIPLFLSLFFLLITNTYALTMSNDNYILQSNTIGTDTQTLPETNTKKVTKAENSNYSIENGFSDLKGMILPLTLSVTPDVIAYGPLSPTNPLTRTTQLFVTAGATKGYRVLTFENHPLMMEKSGIRIPNTSCDNGLCTKTATDTWTSILTYGFGYHCDSVLQNSCGSEFKNSTSYKQFADATQLDIPETLLQSYKTADQNQAQITYKLNIAGTQPTTDTYSNTVTYILVPNF